jgi:thiol-disulfide isomerase/thioredoxin
MVAQVAEDATTLVKLNANVPEFSFEKSPGNSVSISSLKNKTVLINFFATWCGPCRQELPHLQTEIYDLYKNNPKFELLIFGREHNSNEVSEFKVKNGFTMPFYPDMGRTIYSKFASQYIPRNFLISPEGKIIYSSIGYDEKDFKQLKQLIRQQVEAD